MIAWLSGVLRVRDDDGGLIVDVNGVGYAVRVPLSLAVTVEVGDPIELHVHTHVREDILQLYGFEDAEQQGVFNALIGVSKVGPKLALNVLGGISSTELARCVDQGDVGRLVALPGVGKRLAERLAMELRGKLSVTGTARAASAAAAPRGGPFADLKSALQNLQYRPKEIAAVSEQLAAEMPDAPFDELLRGALRRLKKS